MSFIRPASRVFTGHLPVASRTRLPRFFLGRRNVLVHLFAPSAVVLRTTSAITGALDERRRWVHETHWYARRASSASYRLEVQVFRR